MKATLVDIPGLVVLEPRVFSDDRGFFYESYNEKTFADLGIATGFVQDNHAMSRRSVLRGLHYQIKHAQAKLVRVIKGEIFDVAVDLRRSSPTFGKWFGIRLSEFNMLQFYVPPNFAHGYLVLSETAEVLYKAGDFYAPQYDRCIVWNDPDIGIEWPLEERPVLSDKDSCGTLFRNAELPAEA